MAGSVARAAVQVSTGRCRAEGEETRKLQSVPTWHDPTLAEVPAWRQGLMVRAWMARTSLIIQQEQYRIVSYMLNCTKHFKSGAIPNAHRIAASYDFDCALAAVPPLEG